MAPKTFFKIKNTIFFVLARNQTVGVVYNFFLLKIVVFPVIFLMLYELLNIKVRYNRGSGSGSPV